MHLSKLLRLKDSSSLAVTVEEIGRSEPALMSNLALWKDPHFDCHDALVAIRELSLSAGVDPEFSLRGITDPGGGGGQIQF